MTSPANQNEVSVDVQQTKLTFPDEVREPFKLILQVIYLSVVFLPFTLWTVISNLFTRSKDIRGNVVLVTGAGRGLGRSLALKFASLECKVACVDIDESNNRETVLQIKQKYPNTVANAYKCNVALSDDIKCLSKNVANDIGEVDIIVNNAGLVSGAKFIDLTPDYLNAMLDVNVKSHFLMIREFLPKMIQRNSGHIVAIASLAGLNGLANASVYSATKHGLIGLMESLYDELETLPHNKVKTTCVCPYFIHTNDTYSRFWELRLPELTVKTATEGIIDAIRKNKRIAAVPSLLYHLSIITRLNNSDNTLHAWMRHILNYLTTNNELVRHELQEPHLLPNAVCDGSCDCQSNLWVHEVSYEEHYRKLLMSRVNVGDTNQANSVDQESLEREASLVMESVDQNRPEEQVVVNANQNAPTDADSSSEEMSHNSDWDFVMYDSDDETTDSDDPDYEVSESDLLKLDDSYESDSEYDGSSDHTYEISDSELAKANDSSESDSGDPDQLSDTYEVTSASLTLDDGYSTDNSDRSFKYRRVSRNTTSGTTSVSSVYEYYYCSTDDDSEYVNQGEWDLPSN